MPSGQYKLMTTVTLIFFFFFLYTIKPLYRTREPGKAINTAVFVQ